MKLTAYNDNVENYMENIFKHFRNFTVRETFFTSLCSKKLRNLRDSMLEEPNARTNTVRD